MTKLPWQHNRSRTRSGNDKTHSNGPQDWFSRATSEPSRQALADLVKAHKREQSGSSSGGKSRSRGNTITSTEWPKEPSRPGSVSVSEASASRPSSSHARDGSIYANSERSEGATKAILAKGSQMLKRTGSKMSLSSVGSSSNLGLTSPPRTQSITSSSNMPARTDEFRKAISSPFDFQHITHTEQAPLVSLGKIEESCMAQYSPFPATEQLSTSDLKIGGSRISSTSLNSSRVAMSADSLRMASRPGSGLPTSPPRPQPPPKDIPTMPSVEEHDFDQSTTKRGSLQSPRFPQLPQLALGSELDITFLSSDVASPLFKTMDIPIANQSEPVVADDAKPLPELPIFHAVTTEDDSARAMKATRLPTLPGILQPGLFIDVQATQPINQLRQSVLSPRHSAFHPSAKASMPNLVSGNHLSAGGRTLARFHSDLALSEQARNSFAISSTRASASFGAIDTMDWEDAVDEAWDAADESDDNFLPMQHAPSPQMSLGSNGYLHPGGTEDSESAHSTPLMMAPLRRASNPGNVEGHQLPCVQEDATDLTGLGISSCPPSGTANNAGHSSRPSSLRHSRRLSLPGQTPNGMLTRSSSQDSIILSIASSINATQRSSNSSVSVDDLCSINRSQSHLPEKPTNDYNAPYELHQTARPESGCLPVDFIEKLSTLGSIPDVVESDDEQMLPIQPCPQLQPQHHHSKSASKVHVPERRSSAIACDPSRRKRSTTVGNRPRQPSRVSYSLFPIAAHPLPSPTAVST